MEVDQCMNRYLGPSLLLWHWPWRPWAWQIDPYSMELYWMCRYELSVSGFHKF